MSRKTQIIVTWDLDEDSDGREGEIIKKIQDGLYGLVDGCHFNDDLPFDPDNFKIRIVTN